MKRPALLLALLLAVAGAALALQYRVDSSGGPAGLGEAVQAAFATWAGVDGARVEASANAAAPNVVRYGDATSMGPDTASLTLSRGGAEGLEVLVNPDAGELLQSALLHETGLLLGLGPARAGAMDPALQEGTPAALAEEDREALLSQNTAGPEDVNRDGTVDFYDLAALAEDYGRTGVNLGSDIDGNRIVDDRDLSLLREAYVFGPPAETSPATPAATGGAEEGLPPVPELEGGEGGTGGAATGGSGQAPGTNPGGGETGGGETGGSATGGAAPALPGTGGAATGGSGSGGAGTGGSLP